MQQRTAHIHDMLVSSVRPLVYTTCLFLVRGRGLVPHGASDIDGGELVVEAVAKGTYQGGDGAKGLLQRDTHTNTHTHVYRHRVC